MKCWQASKLTTRLVNTVFKATSEHKDRIFSHYTGFSNKVALRKTTEALERCQYALQLRTGKLKTISKIQQRNGIGPKKNKFHHQKNSKTILLTANYSNKPRVQQRRLDPTSLISGNFSVFEVGFHHHI